MLSLLETHTWNGQVERLHSFAPQDRPPMLVPFYSFRIMAGPSIFPLAISRNNSFLRFTVLCGFLPELGRSKSRPR